MGAVAALGLALHGRRPLFALAVLPCLAAMPMIKSRSSLVLVAVGAFVVLFVGRGVRARTVTVAAIVLVLLAAPTIVTSTYDAVLGERAAADLSQTDAARAAAAQVAFDVAVDHPVLGVGYGNFPVYAAQDPALGFELNTHNDYLRIASEAGLGAFAALVYVLASGVRSMRRLRHGTPALAVALVYCTALLVANPLSNLVVSTGFWVLLGASVGAARATRSVDDAAVAAPAV
jgi:O-antigen ligase